MKDWVSKRDAETEARFWQLASCDAYRLARAVAASPVDYRWNHDAEYYQRIAAGHAEHAMEWLEISLLPWPAGQECCA